MHKIVTKANFNQGQNPFFGIDHWELKIIPKGSILVQFDHRDKNKIESKKEVSSQYFTDLNTLKKKKNIISDFKTGKFNVNAREFGKYVQSGPRREDRDVGQHTYPKHVALYQVSKDLPMAIAVVRCNPHLGKGGSQQYFTDLSKMALLQEGYLKLDKISVCIQRENDLPYYRSAERKRKTDTKITELHEENYRQLIPMVGSQLRQDILQGKTNQDGAIGQYYKLDEKGIYNYHKHLYLPKLMDKWQNGKTIIPINDNVTKTIDIYTDPFEYAAVMEMASGNYTKHSAVIVNPDKLSRLEKKGFIAGLKYYKRVRVFSKLNPEIIKDIKQVNSNIINMRSYLSVANGKHFPDFKTMLRRNSESFITAGQAPEGISAYSKNQQTKKFQNFRIPSKDSPHLLIFKDFFQFKHILRTTNRSVLNHNCIVLKNENLSPSELNSIQKTWVKNQGTVIDYSGVLRSPKLKIQNKSSDFKDLSLENLTESLPLPTTAQERKVDRSMGMGL